MVVSKDILTNFPPGSSFGAGGASLMMRSGVLKAESSVGSEEEMGRGPRELVARPDNFDNIFMEDVRLLPLVQQNIKP